MDKQSCIKIISFNCKSVTRSVECVKSLCQTADIIVLQETWLQPQDVAFLGNIDQNFDFTGKSAIDTGAGLLRGRPYGGVGILWRKNIFESVSVIKCNSARITAIKILSAAGRSLLLFSVYMPTDSKENIAEFTECMGEISAVVEESKIDSVVVIGDFNAHPGTEFGNELNDFCVDQSWRCADIEMLGLESESYTYVSDAHGTTRWLDHCVVSEAAWKSILDVRIQYNVYWSDHFPLEVVCDLDVLRAKSVNLRKEPDMVIWGERNLHQISLYQEHCNRLLKCVDFPYEVRECCDQLCANVDHRRVIDNLYASIISALRSAATSSHNIMKGSTRKRKYVVGWNKYVRPLHEEARLGFHNWVLYGKPKTGLYYDSMVESRKRFKKKLKWCQDNAEQIKADILACHHSNKNFGTFWKQTSKMTPRSSLPVNVMSVSDPFKIAELFKTQFKVDSPLGPTKDAPKLARLNQESLMRFTASEVKAAVRSMTRGKSPGHDSLSIEHLQYAGVHLPRVLAMLFTLCIGHTYLPDDMLKTIVVPVPKNRTGDASDVNNYRPISLATIICKVLDSVLDKHLEKNIHLHDAQFGFRSGLSTEAAVLCLKHTVRHYTDRGTPVYACFLDLSRAFDLVSYDLLWKKLYNLSVPGALIELFKYWYGNQTNRIRWAGSMSGPFRLQCGVRQGGLTSPRLFCLYMNQLIDELSNTRAGCSVGGQCFNNISYADDMVLLSPSVCALRKLLDTCERYAETHGLRYNASKSELLLFRAGTKTYNIIPPVELGGVTLKIVSKFKYLGHWVTASQSDDLDVERERRALSVRSNMLVRRFAKCTTSVKTTLFRAYCQTFYTCSLWINCTKKACSALRVLYNNAFRMLMGLPRYCSASGMFAEAHTDDFYAVMRKRVASLMVRVRGSANSLLSAVANTNDSPILSHWTKSHESQIRCEK